MLHRTIVRFFASPCVHISSDEMQNHLFSIHLYKFFVCLFVCIFAYNSGNGCNDRLQIFRVAPGRPGDCFRVQKNWGKCHGLGAQLVISRPVGYAAKCGQPTSVYLPAKAGTQSTDMVGWVGLVYWFTRPKMVTYPRTNQARRQMSANIVDQTVSLIVTPSSFGGGEVVLHRTRPQIGP